MSAPFEKELTVAIVAAEKAAQAVMQLYQKEVWIKYKDNPPDGQLGQDPVTEADHTSNDIIVQSIQTAFPNDDILTEESPFKSRKSERIWVIDPLDGTREFVAKNGEFCVMIALVQNGVPVLGVIACPTMPDATSKAGRCITVFGAGSSASLRINGELQKTPLTLGERPADYPHARFIFSRSRRPPQIEALLHHCGATSFVFAGSVGIKVAKIILNEADVYVHLGLAEATQGPSIWDVAAPDAIARAIGFKVSDQFGNPIVYDANQPQVRRGLLFCPPPLKDSIVSAIRHLDGLRN